MTDAAAARTSLDRAQSLLEQVSADLDRFDETLAWLDQASARANELAGYYEGQGQTDTAAVLAADPEAITPPVANEDAAWETLAGVHERLQRLLRFATAELTSDLDREW